MNNKWLRKKYSIKDTFKIKQKDVKRYGTNLLFLFLSLIWCHPQLQAQEFWQKLPGPIGGTVQSSVINANGDIFLGTFGGVYRSIDNGNNWSEINNGLPYVFIVTMEISQNGHIYAGTWGEGVFRSTDNGDSWIQGTNSGLNDLKIGKFGINADGVLFASAHQKVSPRRLFYP